MGKMTKIKLKKTNHFIHAILTLFTCMLWAIPWVLITNANNRHNAMLEAHELVKKEEEKKLWTIGNVFSAWMTTIFGTFVAFMLSHGDKEITIWTGAILAIVATSITAEFIMKKRDS